MCYISVKLAREKNNFAERSKNLPDLLDINLYNKIILLEIN